VTATRRNNPERSFGVSVGAVLCAIALPLLWRGRIGRAELVGATGVLLLGLGLGRPRLLKWPSSWWWRISRVLGEINARVLLTLLFAVVFVPLSLLWRLTGFDPLGRRRNRWPGWVPSAASHRDRGHYARMY
jgi:hypothetical protein